MINTSFSTDIHKMIDGLFAIKGQVFINEKQVIEGFFYVDTGSTINLINSNYLNKKQMINNVDKVAGIGNATTLLKKGYVGIKMEHQKGITKVLCHSMPSNHQWPDGIIGLLGYKYLKQHKLIVDFNRGALYNKIPSMPFEKSDFSLCTSLENLAIPYLPVLRFMDNKQKDYNCVIDSGAETNVICQHTIECGCFDYTILNKEKSIISGMGSCLETIPSDVNISILGTHVINGINIQRKFREKFEVAFMKNNLLPSTSWGKIDALLGIEFLQNNKCIINCETGTLQIN